MGFIFENVGNICLLFIKQPVRIIYVGEKKEFRSFEARLQSQFPIKQPIGQISNLS